MHIYHHKTNTASIWQQYPQVQNITMKILHYRTKWQWKTRAAKSKDKLFNLSLNNVSIKIQ